MVHGHSCLTELTDETNAQVLSLMHFENFFDSPLLYMHIHLEAQSAIGEYNEDIGRQHPLQGPLTHQ